MVTPLLLYHADHLPYDSSCAVPGQALPEMSRGSSFNLNLDVVRMILSFCYASDLLQISLASHQLRDEAMKEIISRPVSLIRNHRAELFGRFMLTSCENPPFSLLKTLILDDIASALSHNILRLLQLTRDVIT